MLKSCVICSATFDVPSRFWKIKKACSPECVRELARRRDHRNGKKRTERRRLGVEYLKPCVACGKPFKPLRTVRTCSAECQYVSDRKRWNLWNHATYETRRGRMNEGQKRRYWDDRENRLEYHRRWNQDAYERDPERFKTYVRNRRARVESAPGDHTREAVVQILVAQKYRCAYCRTPLTKSNTHIDHIVAITRGGSNDRRNLQATCRTCNISKRDNDPIEYAQSIGLLL